MIIKYCKYCGSQSEDNQLCQCPEARAERNDALGANKSHSASSHGKNFDDSSKSYEASSRVNENGNHDDQVAVNIDVDQLKNDISLVFKDGFNAFINPASNGGAYFRSLNYKKSLIMMAISGLFSSIFAVILGAKVNNGSSDLLNGMIPTPYEVNVFPLFRAFVLVLLYSVIFSVIFAGICHVFGLIFKTKANFEKNMAIAAIRSTYTIPFKLLAIILGLLFPDFAIVVFFMASTLSSTSISASVFQDPSIPKNSISRASIFIKFIFVFAFVFLGAIALVTISNPQYRDAIRYLF